ncbi:MAG: CoA-acylating methylmalonate-semialdehyde dehydrogenase [Legionellaceae bacterium]|nr:CoA-acylating methylmalonate-semialdehyde dehydrogenase [Legionellaceae bacterium]
MIYTVPHFINGKPVTEAHDRTHALHNPATGQRIGQVYFASEALCDNAVAAAKEASPGWAETTPVKRAQILFNFRELLIKNQLELAHLVTKEHGKTIDDAKGSIARGIEVVDYHCGIINQLQGSFSANVSSQIDCYTLRQPLGICAGVSPFNFPVMVPIWMIIPAIACGNTFILKPSEQDPSAPVKLLELLSEAGLPPGVAQCIHGDKATVDQLLMHSDISAFTAVASTPVAESIYKTAIAQGKRAHTFGSAKNHCVVMPDADLDQTAQALVGAAYGSAGERCMAISVIVAVGQHTAEKLLEKLKPLVEKIRIGAGDSPSIDMGPLVSSAHRQRVLAAVDQGIAEGAKLIIDGRAFKHDTLAEGFFMGPCLFDQVTEEMSIYQQELFGPVLIMIRVEHLDDALALVNKNQYGNGTAIFTRDGYSAREYAHRVQVGMVGVNIPIPVPIANHPFGGWKRSAFGDTNMHGNESIHFYTKIKTITSKWFLNQLNDNVFAMPENG